MLFKGETFNKRKAELMEELRRSRSLMTEYWGYATEKSRYAKEWRRTWELQKEHFDKTLNDLIALKRFKIKQKIGDDDEWQLPTTENN